MDEPTDEDRKFDLVMSARAELKRPLPPITRARDGFQRKDVVNAFASAFNVIGGVSRLALWANENPTEFYKLYARLMPSNTLQINATGEKIIIEHAIGPTPLDQHPEQDGSD